MIIGSTDCAGALIKELAHCSVYSNDKLSRLIVWAPFVHCKQYLMLYPSWVFSLALMVKGQALLMENKILLRGFTQPTCSKLHPLTGHPFESELVNI